MWSTAVSLMISFVFSTLQMVSLADFLTWSLAGSLLTSLLHSGCWRMCWPIRAQSVGVTEPIRSLCWKVNRILLVIDMCDHSDIFNPFPCGFMFSVVFVPAWRVTGQYERAAIQPSRPTSDWARDIHLVWPAKPLPNVPSSVALQQTQLNTTNLWPPVVLVRTKPPMQCSVS